jgi:hypothetical protein
MIEESESVEDRQERRKMLGLRIAAAKSYLRGALEHKPRNDLEIVRWSIDLLDALDAKDTFDGGDSEAPDEA